jgi:hypothetical protein
MRGETEKCCLDFVRQKVAVESSFGLTPDDFDRISGFVRSAKPNPNSNEFPDFAFDGGFIEHFQVTSANESAKGSQHKKDRSQFLQRIEESTKEAVLGFDDNEIQRQPLIHELVYSKHSHSNLVNSFKKNWEHHIHSAKRLAESHATPQCGIFMVEYTERALHMAENILPDIDFGKGISLGDFPCSQVFYDYRLSRDTEVLDYLYRFKEQIEFVIYRYSDGIEIIKLENIPIIKQCITRKYEIAPAIGTREVCRTYCLGSIPIDNDEEK